MEKKICIICLDSNINKVKDYNNTTPLFEQQHIYQCNNCNGYFSFFRKNKNELKEYYTNTNSSSIGKKSGYLSNVFAKSISIITCLLCVFVRFFFLYAPKEHWLKYNPCIYYNIRCLTQTYLYLALN